MSGPVLTPYGLAVCTDLETGEVVQWPVPTAIENVKLGQGRYAHGEHVVKAPAPAAAPVVEEPPVPLRHEGVLDLPAGESAEPAPEAPAPAVPAAPKAHKPKGFAGRGK